MNWLCHATLRQLSPNNTASPVAKAESFLHDLSAIDSALQPHLDERQSCKTVQQIQEHYAFELHKNFVVSTICSPLVSGGLSAFNRSSISTLLARLQDALKRSARAYISLRSVTSYARRSWAFIHNGLASVLLLGLMKETRNTPDVSGLQEEVIRSLMDADGEEEAANQLSGTHQKALKALQSLRKLSEQEHGDIGGFEGGWGGDTVWTTGVDLGSTGEVVPDMVNFPQQPQPGYVITMHLPLEN